VGKIIGFVNMENLSLIFFGKPYSYESYELRFGVKEVIKNTHPEPLLKLKKSQKAGLHVYRDKKFYYLELYEFVLPHNSSREGASIGICIKSEKPLEICRENLTRLREHLKFFKDAFTINDEFKSLTCEDTMSSIQLAEEDLSDLKHKDLLKYKSVNQSKLIFHKDFEQDIENIKNELNKEESFYLVNDKAIFEETINEQIYYEFAKDCYSITSNRLLSEREKEQRELERIENEQREINIKEAEKPYAEQFKQNQFRQEMSESQRNFQINKLNKCIEQLEDNIRKINGRNEELSLIKGTLERRNEKLKKIILRFFILKRKQKKENRNNFKTPIIYPINDYFVVTKNNMNFFSIILVITFLISIYSLTHLKWSEEKMQCFIKCITNAISPRNDNPIVEFDIDKQIYLNITNHNQFIFSEKFENKTVKYEYNSKKNIDNQDGLKLKNIIINMSAYKINRTDTILYRSIVNDILVLENSKKILKKGDNIPEPISAK